MSRKRSKGRGGKQKGNNLESVVCPAAELEHARLLVEGEVLDIDLATGFVDGRRLPLDQPAVIHGGFG